MTDIYNLYQSILNESLKRAATNVAKSTLMGAALGAAAGWGASEIAKSSIKDDYDAAENAKDALTQNTSGIEAAEKAVQQREEGLQKFKKDFMDNKEIWPKNPVHQHINGQFGIVQTYGGGDKQVKLDNPFDSSKYGFDATDYLDIGDTLDSTAYDKLKGSLEARKNILKDLKGNTEKLTASKEAAEKALDSHKIAKFVSDNGLTAGAALGAAAGGTIGVLGSRSRKK